MWRCASRNVFLCSLPGFIIIFTKKGILSSKVCFEKSPLCEMLKNQLLWTQILMWFFCNFYTSMKFNPWIREIDIAKSMQNWWVWSWRPDWNNLPVVFRFLSITDVYLLLSFAKVNRMEKSSKRMRKVSRMSYIFVITRTITWDRRICGINFNLSPEMYPFSWLPH